MDSGSFGRPVSGVHGASRTRVLLAATSIGLAGAGLALLLGSDSYLADVEVPDQSDWIDHGWIFSRGELGEWDHMLWGGFGATAVKKDGTYYLYYQGADGYRLIEDETVTGRAIGVATSPDGINFTKYSGNPVIRWSPTGSGEEGAASSAASVDSYGQVVLHYGANTAVSPTTVEASGRIAISPDGFHFEDRGVALDTHDPSVWGSGDELFPVATLRDGGRWLVYYIPNGTLQRGKLGVAWGSEANRLTGSAGVRGGLRSVDAWGPVGSGELGSGTFVLLLSKRSNDLLELRAGRYEEPTRLSKPLAVYRYPDLTKATLLLDSETRTWFMYYRDGRTGRYGVKLAPAGPPDTTPPVPPATLSAEPLAHDRIRLAWSGATDPETGIAAYDVYRDETRVARVKGWAFTDSGLVERRPYAYRVAAVNYHGAVGPPGDAVSTRTRPDSSPPRVLGVTGGEAGEDRVTLWFAEAVDSISAARPASYAIDGGVRVLAAGPGPDGKSVVLTTTGHTDEVTYTISIGGIADRSLLANRMPPGTQLRYLFSSVPGLVGAWTLDEGAGLEASDSGNWRSHGRLGPGDAAGPVGRQGRRGGSLYFDGIDDAVVIQPHGPLHDVTSGSHTFAAWVRPEGPPPNRSPNDASYSILTRDETGLFYDHDRRFRALVRTASGEEVELSSSPVPPDRWYHVVSTVDASRGALRLFVDGVEVPASPVSYEGELADVRESPFYAGTADLLHERHERRLRGLIDEIRVYGRALDPSEVSSVMSPLDDP